MTTAVFSFSAILLIIIEFYLGLTRTNEMRPNRGSYTRQMEMTDCDRISFTGSCICCDGKSCPERNDCSLCPQGHHLEQVSSCRCASETLCNETRYGCDENRTLNYCHPCKYGYYQPRVRMQECVKCPNGYETIAVGGTLCIACPRGYYKNSSMINCQPCPAGQEAILEASESCTSCFEGTHKFMEGPQLCKPCIQGHYILTKGALYCLPCPAGYYCPCSKCGPVTCPDETNCPEGSNSPIYCSSPLFRWVTDGCYVSTTLLGIIVAVIFFSILLMSVIVARIYFRPQRCPSSTWTSIGEDSFSSEPVYSGL